MYSIITVYNNSVNNSITAIRGDKMFKYAGDVIMVVTWAAMIPGLMWLGAAAGF